MSSNGEKPVFLTGATGFIGEELYPKLVDAGFRVRCGTRRPENARRKHPDREWVEFDVERPGTMTPAMDGCGSAFYLIHQMGGGEGYRERERRAAIAFRDAVDELGMDRVVYLGGVEPVGPPSEHLASRLKTGKVLRGGDVSTVELRASMIIGSGSASWQIVRDLAARLPVMILPEWTQSKSQPVDIDDVTRALIGALRLEMEGSDWFDIPGPDVLSVEDILVKTARLMGHETRRYPVPLLSPRLSSYWLKFVTQCDVHLARELVEGLKTDLLARDYAFWDRIDHTELISFEDSARKALDETSPDSTMARAYEGLVGALSRSESS